MSAYAEFLASKAALPVPAAPRERTWNKIKQSMPGVLDTARLHPSVNPGSTSGSPSVIVQTSRGAGQPAPGGRTR